MSHLTFYFFIKIFGIFNELLSTQNVNVARFARNVEWDIFVIFKDRVQGVPICCDYFRVLNVNPVKKKIGILLVR